MQRLKNLLNQVVSKQFHPTTKAPASFNNFTDPEMATNARSTESEDYHAPQHDETDSSRELERRDDHCGRHRDEHRPRDDATDATHSTDTVRDFREKICKIEEALEVVLHRLPPATAQQPHAEHVYVWPTAQSHHAQSSVNYGVPRAHSRARHINFMRRWGHKARCSRRV